MDALRLFSRHLDAIGTTDKIALFLYTTGGDTMVPWRLVNLIREYCKRFVVLVPYKAHSAGTLICLGADEIIMTKNGELSPVDPSVSNAFNPVSPAPPGVPSAQLPQNRIPISVEDVAAYFKLAIDRAGLDTPEGRLGAFQQLASVVHPLALGNVQRSQMQIRDLAKKLLGLHMDLNNQEQREKCDFIVDTLTEKLYSHRHLIPRREAKEIIGLKVRYPENELENLMMSLYREYESELSIGGMFNPMLELGDRTELAKELTIAKIETTGTEDKFVLKGRIIRAAQPNQPPSVNIYDQRWERIL
jgi:hypothetical protein